MLGFFIKNLAKLPPLKKNIKARNKQIYVMKRSLDLSIPIFSLIISVFFSSFTLPAQTFSLITKESHPHFDCLQVENLPNNHPDKELLQVFLYSPNSDHPAVPILGQRIVEADKIYFCPLIPFSKNLTYQARFDEFPYFTFTPLPDNDYTPTVLTNVYPSIDRLPENILKMYLYFSAPMSDGDGYQYLEVSDEHGEKIASPFLELRPLLWNQDRTRLTVWFDPGRVKRELLRHEKLGAPLEKGKKYTLSISKNWKDANGYALAHDFVKKMEVIAADRSAPNPKDWTMSVPKINTNDPLIIRFGENLDHAMAAKSLSIQTQKGQPIEGEIILQKADTEWLFMPVNSWKSNFYTIQINAALEDLAGNNLNRLFDREVDKQNSTEQHLPYYHLDFLIEE